MLQKLSDGVCNRPWCFVLPQVLLFAACLGYSATNLKFSTSRADLISPDDKYQRAYLEFKREFRFPDSLVAIVESESREKNRRFVERLAMKLNGEPRLFSDTHYKGDLTLMGEKGLLFLPEESLKELRRVIYEDWPFIETFAEADSLAALLELVNGKFRAGGAELSGERSLDRVLPVLNRVLEEAGESISSPGKSAAPGVAALFGHDSRLYLSFAGGQIYAVITHPANPEVEGKAIQRLRELVEETRMELPGVNAGVTGEKVLDHDEMRQARRDIQLAAMISIALVAIIFIYGYHELARPLLATFCLLIGIGFTLGFATLTVGRLTILSITLVPILIGLAIDFGVHLITRFEEELRKGRGQRTALRKALGFTGIGVFTSAFTTAGAFFAMTLTDFEGIREMGFLSGAGLLVCLIPMLTLLPVLLVRGKPDLPDRVTMRRQSGFRARIEQVWLKRQRLVLLCGAVLTLFSASQFDRLHFDYNLLNLQSRDLQAVAVEEKLARSGTQSFLYGAVIADSLEQAKVLEEQISRLPSVSHVSSMVGYLTEDQSRKLMLIGDVKEKMRTLRLPAPDVEAMNPAELNQLLYSLQGYAGVVANLLLREGGDPEVEAHFRAMRNSAARLRSLLAEDEQQAVRRLTGFQEGVFGNLHESIRLIQRQDVRERLKAEDLPSFLRERFISDSGRFLLQVFPKEDVWEREKQEEFVLALREMAPDVTGTLIQIYEYTSRLKRNFLKASGYAAGVIAILMLVHFRRIGSVLLAFIPVLLGLCWMLGIMGFAGIPFNPVNMMALTLVIGIGVANGVHIVNRFAEEPHSSILAKSTGKAVLVSAFTSMAGFGSLMVAEHQGIASLGVIMTIGTGMCMLASLTVFPVILRYLAPLMYRAEPRKPEKGAPAGDRQPSGRGGAPGHN